MRETVSKLNSLMRVTAERRKPCTPKGLITPAGNRHGYASRSGLEGPGDEGSNSRLAPMFPHQVATPGADSASENSRGKPRVFMAPGAALTDTERANG